MADNQLFSTVSPDISATTNNPDFTRRSEGFQADQSLATVLKTGADVLGMAIKGTDQYIRELITDDVTKRVDDVRDEAVAKSVVTLATPGIPDELQEVNRQLDTLNTAKKQGKIRDSHYWAKLDLIARQTRTRFPGYREHIDNTISGLTGTTPANQLVKSLAAEVDAASTNMTEDAKFRRQLMKENAQYLTDAIAADNTDQRWSTQNMMLQVGRMKKFEGDLQIAKAQREAVKDNVQLSGELLTIEHNKQAHLVFNKHMAAFVPELERLTQQYEQETQQTGQASAETINTINKFISQQKTRFTTEMSKVSAQPDYASGDSTKLRQNVENYSKQFDTMIASVQDGTLALTAKKTKAIMENAELAATSNAQIRQDAVLHKMLGPTISSWYFNVGDRAQRLDAVKQFHAVNLGVALANGTSVPNLIAEGRKQGLPDGVISDVLRNGTRLLKDPSVPQEVWKKTFDGLFGRQSDPSVILSIGKSAKDTRAIFDNWTTPQMTAAVKKHSSADPQVYSRYTEWVGKAAQTVFHRELSDIRENTTSGDLVDVRFQDGRFIAYPRYLSTITEEQALTNRENNQLRDAMARSWNSGRLEGLNKVVSHLTPIWLEAKKDPKIEATKLLGIGLEQYKQKGTSLEAFRESFRMNLETTVGMTKAEQEDLIMKKQVPAFEGTVNELIDVENLIAETTEPKKVRDLLKERDRLMSLIKEGNFSPLTAADIVDRQPPINWNEQLPIEVKTK